jgi:lipopolysaccharide export system protein LptA
MRTRRNNGRKIAARAGFILAWLLLGTAAFPASTLTYSGDSMTTDLAEGNKRATLTGHARVQTESMVINADRILLTGKDFIYAQCSGNVRVVDTKRGLELTSDQLYYDRQKKIARVRGNAMMADLKNELVVKGGFIEDRDQEKLTVIQIGVRILKKDMVCRAEFARYNRENKTLELSGLPWVTRKGDEYRAARITVNIDTEEISLEVNVQGQISTEETSPPKTAAPQSGEDATQPPPSPEPAAGQTSGQPSAGTPGTPRSTTPQRGATSGD